MLVQHQLRFVCFKNGKEIDQTEVTAGDDGQWLYKFIDLPKYDAAGDAYKYTVKEDPNEATSSLSTFGLLLIVGVGSTWYFNRRKEIQKNN